MAGKKSLLRPEDALSLPPGSAQGLALSPQNVQEAAQQLIGLGDTAEVKSQAEVITRALRHGWSNSREGVGVAGC